MRGYLDLWTGLSGDMMVGALLDAGWPEEAMRTVLGQIPIGKVTVTVESRSQHGIRGRGIRVDATEEPPERPYREVRRLLFDSSLEPVVKERSLALFQRLAEAEGAVHGIDPEEVHFHELGAVDSIVDIVLSVAGIEGLGIDRLSCGAVPLSRGEVRTAHGLLPVPTPATLRLLEGKPIRWLPVEGEWMTPTGALLLSTLVDIGGPPPDLRLARVGTGAGTKISHDRPNIVRLLVGEGVEADGEGLGWVSVLETNLDDLDPRIEAEVSDRLLEAGALDVVRIPAVMKKGRMGTLLSVLCRAEAEERLGSIILRDTSTLGIRIRREFRRELERWVETVATRFGPVRIKWSRPGGIARATPEFDDIAALARSHHVPPWQVERAALAAADPTRRVVREEPSDRPEPSTE